MPSLRYRLLRRVGHQYWLPFGVRDRILRAFAHPDWMLPRPFQVPFNGFIYEGDLSQFLDWEVYFYGAYEQGILWLLDDLAGLIDRQISALTFIDVGANVGHHSLFMTTRAGRVVAFEPLSDVRRQMERKIELNYLHEIEVYPFALGEKDETLTFHAPVGNNTGTGSFLAEYNPDNNQQRLEVPVVNGSKVFKELNVKGPAILKIDVEGFEFEVLKGLQSFIRKERPVIVFEISKATREKIGTIKHLTTVTGADYLAFAIEQVPPRYNLLPLQLRGFDGNALLLPAEMADWVEGIKNVRGR